MKTLKFINGFAALLLFAILAIIPALAGTLQPISRPSPNLVSAGGGGDSMTPILSPDGRYVLFASTAPNLALVSNNIPTPLPRLNVFLRDRSNGTTTLISQNLAGTGPGNGDSWPVALSTNGQYVLFESLASDLVPNDNNRAADVFLRDLVAGTNLLVSANTNGIPGDGASRNAAMTPDGRFVAFTSDADDLVSGDTNGIPDVFVRNMTSSLTTLVSAGAMDDSPDADNLWLPKSLSDRPDITPDGRYIAFYSTATNLVPGVTNIGNIYVRDLVAAMTMLVSGDALFAVSNAYGASNALCYNHSISADGQFVAYEARALPFTGTNTAAAILRYNLPNQTVDLVSTNANAAAPIFDDPANLSMTPDGQTIAFVGNTNSLSSSNTSILVWSAKTASTFLASGDTNNTIPGNSLCDWPVLSSDGRYVAFISNGAGLATNDSSARFHAYVRDLQSTSTALLDIDLNNSAAGVNPETIPALSPDGRFAAFHCFDSSLATNDNNHALDVFVRDMAAGTTELVSVHQPTLPAVTASAFSLLFSPSVSTNGRYVTFASDADNLVANDTSQTRDVFVSDLLLGTNQLVSVSTNGSAANGWSSESTISGDGRYVAFSSEASNLTTAAVKGNRQVFLRDLQNGTTLQVSLNTSQTSSTGACYAPSLSRDGRYIFFRSWSPDLVKGSLPLGHEFQFVRDLQTGSNYVISASGLYAYSVSRDGRFFFYTSTSGGAVTLWDNQRMSSVYSRSVGNTTNFTFTASTNHLIYSTGTQVFEFDRASNVTYTISSNGFVPQQGLRTSADSRWLVYVTSAAMAGTDNNATNDVFLYDLQAHTNALVSLSYLQPSPTAGNAASDTPDISADGRYILYRSQASDLVPNDTNGLPDIFLYDRINGTTTIITPNQKDNPSIRNVFPASEFSADSQTLIFQSWLPGLIAQDFNFGSDVMAYTLLNSQTLVAQIVAGAVSGGPATITWTAHPATLYRAQYKMGLTDATWQDIAGGVSINGTQGSFTDPAPDPARRFYRIVAY